MIQGGDPTGTGMGGSVQTIKGEFASNGINNPIKHTRGTISMARSQDPNSASSQFFIVHKDSLYLDGNYAGFGSVVEGMDIVDKIASVQTDYRDRPLFEQKSRLSMKFSSLTAQPLKKGHFLISIGAIIFDFLLLYLSVVICSYFLVFFIIPLILSVLFIS